MSFHFFLIHEVYEMEITLKEFSNFKNAYERTLLKTEHN